MLDQARRHRRARCIFHFGDADPYIPNEEVDAIRAGDRRPARAVELNVEAGAGHAFDNHEAPMF